MTPQFDMRTKYLGLELAHPIVASSSPLTGDLDHLHALAEAGAAAVVLPSLFEEQVTHEALALHRSLDQGSGASPEATTGYFPEMDSYNTGAASYLDLLEAAKQQLSIPVLASLNGSSAGGWTLYAKILADRGADALELNIYHIAGDPKVTGAGVEATYLRLVESVRNAIDIPLAVKIGPYFSSLGSFAHRLSGAGADALVLFNRFYQPDIDVETLSVRPDLDLSTSADLRLPLRWIGMLAGRVDCDLAATSGVHDHLDVVKMLFAGADVTMMASALLRHGPAHLSATLTAASEWFRAHDYRSVSQARGSMSQAHVSDPAGYERSNYMRTITSYSPDWA